MLIGLSIFVLACFIGIAYYVISTSAECPDGLEGANCVDIDECERKKACVGKLHCTNSIGSYSCGCSDGFKTRVRRAKSYVGFVSAFSFM